MEPIQVPDQIKVNQYNQLLEIDGVKLAYYRRFVNSCKTKVSVTAHSILYVVNGHKYLHSKAGLVDLHAGDVAFIQKGSYVTTERIVSKGSFDGITIFLPDALLQNFIESNRKQLQPSNTEKNYSDLFIVRKSKKLMSYFASLLPYFEEGTQNDRLLRLKFEELLLTLLETDESKVFSNFLKRLTIDREISFENFMEQHFDRNLTVNELAFLNGKSLSSFKRAFKDVYNESPGKWIKDKRLEKAQFLVQQTDKAIAEIAEDCGYESSSHFIAQYKDKFGNPPKKHRVLIS